MIEGLVLAMDGSTSCSTTALLTAAGAPIVGRVGREGGGAWRMLARRTDVDGRGQARALLRLVDEMLNEIGGGPAGISAIVAGSGPGTFTGVRIAVATARGLALALGVPVIGVSTLSALAADAVTRREGSDQGPRPDLVVPVVDARRSQVFFGVYRLARNGGGEGAGLPLEPSYVRAEPFAACDRNALGARLAALSRQEARAPRALVVGDVDGLDGVDGVDGVDTTFLALDVRAECLLAGQSLLQEPGEVLAGSRLGPWIDRVLARGSAGRQEASGAGDLGSPEAVRPIYVRSPDADIHITKMRDPWAAPAPDR
jgi:tRNA threonylcarbamoyl adenosine modification protein YeaZ